MVRHAQESAERPDPLEFVRAQLFWLLGGLLLFNGYWVNQQVVKSSRGRDPATHAPVTPSPPVTGTAESPRAAGQRARRRAGREALDAFGLRYDLFWLRPHITSRLRQAIAVVACTLVLPVQLLEGSWMLRTAWRVTMATHAAVHLSTRLLILRCVAYLPCIVVGAITWYLMLWVGMLLVMAQITYIAQLLELEPRPVSKVTQTGQDGKREAES
jgi:hypothetical protein